MKSYIDLDRQFSAIPRDLESGQGEEDFYFSGLDKLKSWEDLDYEYRCVILAEAGAGKTEELRQRSLEIAGQQKLSFFIRIEDIDADFWNSFEVGDATQFHEWLQSTSEAWFFLDSIDEARLENPRSFEKALRRFATYIHDAAHRAHIYLSSRPYAWRPKDDSGLLDEILFLSTPAESEESREERNFVSSSALTFYTLRPLDEDRIRRFSVARETQHIDRLLLEIERGNLWSLAERPFDLEAILAKWVDDEALGGRLELLRHNIDKRLRDEHNIDRAQRQPINLNRARQGARRLAAAVLLTGNGSINVPDGDSVRPGIEAEAILDDWHPDEVRALLDRGVFDDVIYGAVRFRHRDIRELLVAEWIDELLRGGSNRVEIDSLIFREQYGTKFIAPRIRPILSWLILFDEEIRTKALAISPEVALEGGDPSRLPLTVRKKLLDDVVRRIASDEDDHSARDNSSIARLAQSDLLNDTQQLIREFAENDDAIFFLGRLVWQGEMSACTPLLVPIASNGTRGIYTRIASTRAVMTCGTTAQQESLWQAIESDDSVSRELLAELIDGSDPDIASVDHLLTLIRKLPPYERFKDTGLSNAIHGFVARLPVGSRPHATVRLLEGMCEYLEKPPLVKRRDCHVSEAFAWLLSPATHAVERLVEVHNAAIITSTALKIMMMVPALRFWRHGDFREHKSNLHELVPAWPELNDALYWASIEQSRLARRNREPQTRDWAVSWLGHYWNFDQESFPRLLEFVRSRPLEEDKLVALSTAVRIYLESGKPPFLLAGLENSVDGEYVLRDALETFLNPPLSESDRKHQAEQDEFEYEQEEKKRKFREARESWIAELRADPERVRNPPTLEPGGFTNDQNRLLNEIRNSEPNSDRYGGENWQTLIPEFGEEVARAYRDAAVSHWRQYKPPLRSRGDKTTGTPYSLIFAMAGIEIEASENIEFFANLDEEQAAHSLQFLTWELNGFPTWFEPMHQRFSVLVENAVLYELGWEMANTEPDTPLHYILHDIVYSAPWLHKAIAPPIFDLVCSNPACINHANRHYCLKILISGGIQPSKLAELANQQIREGDPDDGPSWYALRVGCDPETGIPEVEHWLETLDEDNAIQSAQFFVTALMGGGRRDPDGVGFDNFRTTEYLKALYMLMRRYIRPEQDINRTGGGVFSPELRDDAQDGRNRLLHFLAEIPGIATYNTIVELSRVEPNPNARRWMANRANNRAEEDGDLEPWTADQVAAFNENQNLTPATHRQLFDLAVNRLNDMKNWLEHGNDSPWMTWARADDEPEIRTLVAGWLNQRCAEQYTTAQEPELANSQRMDIWLHNTNVQSPVPIELKLLDKNWSGPKLCERLRNQLVGDYLRESSASCGIFLLIWQGRIDDRRWKIDSHRVDLGGLADALKQYWQSISDLHDEIQAVEVIVIDLTARGTKTLSQTR